MHGVYRHHTFCCVQGLKLHAAFKLSFILAVLQKHGLVSPAVAESVTSFIAANQTFGGGSSAPAAAPAPAATPAKQPRYSLLDFLQTLPQPQQDPPAVLVKSSVGCCCTW